MADAGGLVRSVYEAHGRRDRDASAQRLVDADAVYELPRTGEGVEAGPAVLDDQRAYLEPLGELSLLRVIAKGQEATAEISCTPAGVAPAGRPLPLCASLRRHGRGSSRRGI